MKMSYTTLAILLTGVAVLFYGAFVLYGTWSDKTDGPREEEQNDGNQRS